MDWSAGPAALGGLMMGAALGAWSLGHWQGRLANAEEPSGPPDLRAVARMTGLAPVTPCQHAARAERRLAPGTADMLGELHAEISAYRRAEQVLAGLDGDDLPFATGSGGADLDCRYMGVTGEPTCGIADAARSACGCDQRPDLRAAPSMPALRTVQPSAAADDVRRV